MLAPRRVGKTSLMLELRRAPLENWDVVYVDVEGGDGSADCIAAILAALVAIPKFRNRLEAFPFMNAVKDILGRLSTTVDTGVWRVELKSAIGCEWSNTAEHLQARLMNDRLSGPSGIAHLDHYATRLEIALDAHEHDVAFSILGNACRRNSGTSLAELEELRRSGEQTFWSVLRDLEADGYLVRDEDRLEFRSNLLRAWWRKRYGIGATQ